MFSCLVNDSGATYKSLVLPPSTSSLTLAISDFVNDEFKKWAMLSEPPKALNWSTWFFINAISGEITIAVPSLIKAGNW
jgi:hypothetical protein